MSSKNSRNMGNVTARHLNLFRLLAVTLGVLLLSVAAFSQGSTGRILGTVTDQSGGVVAGAAVFIIDTARGVSRTLTSDDAGEYNAPNLTPGIYTVRAEAKGFRKLERQNVEVGVGKEVRVDITVQPGEQEQTVTVTEAIPLIETSSATLGGTLNNAEISDMPLNGRNYQNLLSLRPGVTLQPGGGPWTQSTNGVRPDETVWMLDGVLNVNTYDARPIANMPTPFSDGGTILPVDAIQEFNLEENPKAEYGWKPGAVVNVGVKSGTNEFHGAAYGFYRSAAWDARNLFNPDVNSRPSCGNNNAEPCTLSPLQLKQFGGVMGGPIKKDKLFFFGGYEGLRDLIGSPIVTSGVPETNSTGSAKHSFVDALIADQAKGVSISPVSLALAGCPAGTLTTASVCTPPSYSWPVNLTGDTSFIAPFPNTLITDNGIAKVDYHINEKNSINALVLIGNYTSAGMDHPFVNKIFEDTNLGRTDTIGADWVSTPNSRWVNDVRFGYDKVTFNFLTNDGTILADGSGLTGGKGFPINTGVTSYGGLPNINLSGFEKLGSWHNRPQNWGNYYYDFQDNVSYLVGRHTFKFGFEFTHSDITNQIPDTVRGLIAFKGKKCPQFAGTSTPLEDFFCGTPSSGNILTGSAKRHETWNAPAVFVQDDWRITSKLTLNVGLRYSYQSPFKEANDQWGNFDPTKGMIQPGAGGTVFNPDRKNFSPRVGFAWDATGKGTTVVRGAFSVLYSSLTAVTFLNQNGFTGSGATSVSLAAVPTGAVLETNGLGLAGNTAPSGSNLITLQSAALAGSALNWNGLVFPGGVAQCGDGLGADASQCSIMAVDPNLKTPYVINWDLGVQHSFGNNLSLEVGYVGDHGSRLLGFRDLNQTDAAGVRPFAVQFPYLKWILQDSNDGHSNFNSLQTTLTKRLSHGVSFIAGYTYSHGLDTGSLNRTAYLPQDSNNPGAEYASGDFDVRHRFTLTTTYNVPGIKGFAQLLEGWRLNAIVSVQSAQPWQTFDSSNDFRGGDAVDRWNITGSPANFRSGPNALPFCTGFGAAVSCLESSGVSGADIPMSTSFTSAAVTACTAAATSVVNLEADGCFVSPNGQTVLTPPTNGTFGNMGRNIFRDSGFKNVDFSVFKMFTWKERYSAQFRVEIFNLFNKPLSANPYGSANGYGVGNDLSAPAGGGGGFGCGCATPDVAGGSPQIGSGAQRRMQLGLKLQF
jgi:hypothetical protein